MIIVPMSEFNSVTLYGYMTDSGDLTLWIPISLFFRFYRHLAFYCNCPVSEIDDISDKHITEVGLLIDAWLNARVGHACQWDLNDTIYPCSEVLHFSHWRELMQLLTTVEGFQDLQTGSTQAPVED